MVGGYEDPTHGSSERTRWDSWHKMELSTPDVNLSDHALLLKTPWLSHQEQQIHCCVRHTEQKCASCLPVAEVNVRFELPCLSERARNRFNKTHKNTVSFPKAAIWRVVLPSVYTIYAFLAQSTRRQRIWGRSCLSVWSVHLPKWLIYKTNEGRNLVLVVYTERCTENLFLVW
jgi:hypothetical protein